MKFDLNYPPSPEVKVLRISKKNKVKAVQRIRDGLIFSSGEMAQQGLINYFNVHNRGGEAWVYIKGYIMGIPLKEISKMTDYNSLPEQFKINT